MYVVGGRGIELESGGPLLGYDPATNTWTTLAALKQSREHMNAVALDGRIYALAGRRDLQELNSVEIYEPADNTWSPGQPMAVARGGFGAAVLEGQIIVAGGEVILTGEYTLDSVEVFDPAHGTWSMAPSLPVKLHGLPAVTIDDTLYIVGGSSRAADIVNQGRVFAYRP